MTLFESTNLIVLVVSFFSHWAPLYRLGTLEEQENWSCREQNISLLRLSFPCNCGGGFLRSSTEAFENFTSDSGVFLEAEIVWDDGAQYASFAPLPPL